MPASRLSPDAGSLPFVNLPDKIATGRDIAVRARRYASSDGFVFLALVVVAVVDVPADAGTIGFED